MTPDARITLAEAPDLGALERDWRALEAAADPSFFQSWTWIGCRAAERFPDPLLLRAERGGRTVGLALLNRRRGGLWLHASGDPALDAIYPEHNGILLARDAGHLLPACLRALLATRRPVHLPGVDAAHFAAARQAGAVRVLQRDAAPFVDLAAPFLASLSANARYQLRRSDRALGPVMVREAATVGEAEAFLDALAALHQMTWTARGKPGAFVNPAFLRFHRALLARAVPRREVVLLRVGGPAGTIGYLYNFRLNGRVLAYQSGFDYAAAGTHGKPGLTCHHAAIAHARADCAAVYDFLAGEDRYKTSLAHSATPLYWLQAAARASPAGVTLALRGWASTLRKTASWPALVGSQPKRSA